MITTIVEEFSLRKIWSLKTININNSFNNKLLQITARKELMLSNLMVLNRLPSLEEKVKMLLQMTKSKV